MIQIIGTVLLSALAIFFILVLGLLVYVIFKMIINILKDF